MDPLPVRLPVPGERSLRTVRRLRDEAGPIVPVELPGGVPAWLVSTYDAIIGVLAGDDELRWILWSVIVAGHETTMHLIANAVVALCGDPVQLDRVRKEDDWAAAVEEALRSRNSVVTTVPRYPLRDVRVAGVDIAAGEAVVLGFGAGGTDPAAYGAGAERFDAGRAPQPHLAFGRGVHFCLGAPLARLEARIALSTLFTRLPRLRLAVPEADLVHTSSIITEGPRALPVLLS